LPLPAYTAYPLPDKRDVLVLGPSPVRARTMFVAKVSAVAVALGLTVLLLNSLMGLIWPLVFTARSAPTVSPALTFDPTPVPVAARDLEATMDRDLRQALTVGELAPNTGLGLAIGVWKNGERRVFTYGAAKPDSLFEIGSITKTFTGLMLARMVEQGKLRLDEPLRDLLPAGILTARTDKNTEAEITLLDLATHHSGLPMMPNNAQPADPSNSLCRLRTGTALRFYRETRRRKAARHEFRLQQSWSCPVGSDSGSTGREKLCRSTAGGDRGSAGHDRHGGATLRRAAAAIPAGAR